MDSTRTRTVERMEAAAELIRDGQGLTPEVSPKNSRYASSVRFAAIDGGLVAASVSEWKEVRIIHTTGEAKSRASSHAAMPAAVLLRVGSIRVLPRRALELPGLAWVLLWGAAGVRVLIVLPPS